MTITIQEFENRVDTDHTQTLRYIDALIALGSSGAIDLADYGLSISELSAARSAVVSVRSVDSLGRIFIETLEGDFDQATELATEWAATELISKGLSDTLIKMSDADLLNQVGGTEADGFRLSAQIFADVTAELLVQFASNVGDQLELLVNDAINNSSNQNIKDGYNALIPFSSFFTDYVSDEDPYNELLSSTGIESLVFATNVIETLGGIPQIPGFGFKTVRQEVKKFFKLKADFVIINLDNIEDRLGDNSTLRDDLSIYTSAAISSIAAENVHYQSLKALAFIGAILPNIDNLVLTRLGEGDVSVSGPGKNAFIILDETDSATATGGSDVILGGRFVDARGGDDFINLDPDAQLGEAYGRGGDDLIYGSNNDDVMLSGGNGADEIWGYGGNDRIDGGRGADFIYGGDGYDSVSYESAQNRGIVLDGVNGSPILLSGSKGIAKLDFLESVERIYGSNFDDIIQDWDPGYDAFFDENGVELPGFSFEGRDGNDTMIVGDGIFFFFGETGDDIAAINVDLVEDTSIFVVDGGIGADRLEIRNYSLNGGENSNSIRVFVHNGEAADSGSIGDFDISIDFESLGATGAAGVSLGTGWGIEDANGFKQFVWEFDNGLTFVYNDFAAGPDELLIVDENGPLYINFEDFEIGDYGILIPEYDDTGGPPVGGRIGVAFGILGQPGAIENGQIVGKTVANYELPDFGAPLAPPTGAPYITVASEEAITLQTDLQIFELADEYYWGSLSNGPFQAEVFDLDIWQQHPNFLNSADAGQYEASGLGDDAIIFTDTRRLPTWDTDDEAVLLGLSDLKVSAGPSKPIIFEDVRPLIDLVADDFSIDAELGISFENGLAVLYSEPEWVL